MARSHEKKTVYLVDASSFLYRAYYALRPLNAPDGTPVHAVYGFCRMINRFFDRFEPEYGAAVWDSPGKTARHEIFPDYKATRQAPPSDLFLQKKLIREFAQMIKLHEVAQEGVEADDLLAALAHDFAKKGIDVVIVTSDKDLGQIAGDHIVLFDPFKEAILDKDAIEKRYGFPIEKVPFFYALVGDTSDNIPGVKGIGEKTAEKLVQQFDSLKDLYENIENVETPRTKKLLEMGKENAFLSEKLFKFHNPHVKTDLDDFVISDHTLSAARPLFERLHFVSLLKELPGGAARPGKGFAESYGYHFKAVTDETTLQELCLSIEHQGSCALDTETDGTSTMQSQLVGISLCHAKGHSYYIPLRHQTGETQIPFDRAIEILKPVLENKKVEKYLHNAKFDMLILRNAGIDLKGLAFDTMVAAGLIRADGDRVGLKALSEQYFKEVMISYKEVVGDRKRKTFMEVPLVEATDYAAADAHQTWRLVEPIQKELRVQKQMELYETIEHPLITVLYEMEFEGIDVDRAVLDEINQYVTRKLHQISNEILDLVGMKGEDINLNSPQQIGELLFKELKLEPVKKTSGKTGYSTDVEVLEELAKVHPVPGLIIKYRELFKIKSTYIDALKEQINPKTGKIHTTFKQTSVATGRLASADPNLQNIPTGEDEKLSIRSAFHAPRGCQLISADYSQIELRVLAYLSQDKNLLEAFAAGEDIHARTASGLFDIPLKEVTHEQRQVAKRINFSILYGLTPYGLSKDLDVPLGDAKNYIDKYMAQYPGVVEWMDTVIQETKENGFVTTLWGRRRPIPGIYEKNRTLYQLAHRVAINTKAQGTAADLMKLGMVKLADRLTKEMPEVKILLQIHDELVFSAPNDQVKAAEELIAHVLDNVVKWNVPLAVAIGSGKNWQSIKK